MAIESFTKQSWESFPVWGSILNVQEDTETVLLGNSTVTAMDKDGKDAGEVLQQSSKALGDDPDGDYSDNMLGMRVRGGSNSKSPYYLCFRMMTSQDNQWEVDIKMKVKDEPSITAISTTTTTT